MEANTLIRRVGRLAQIGRQLCESKIVKGLLVVVLITVLILLVSFNLENALVRAKRLFKYRSNAGVSEISGLDE
jgi:hypothetical protein